MFETFYGHNCLSFFARLRRKSNVWRAFETKLWTSATVRGLGSQKSSLWAQTKTTTGTPTGAHLQAFSAYQSNVSG